MKTKNIVVSIVLIIAVVALFGYRYWYTPNFIMAKRPPVIASPKPQTKRQETKKGEPAPPTKVVKKESPKKEIVKKESLKKEVPKPKIKSYKNLLKNSTFKTGKEKWRPWQHAKNQPENITIINVENNKKFDSALRIENPKAVLIGLQQLASLKSGTVYRLSGSVRSTQNNDNKRIFGGRVALFLPPQKEKEIVWMSEYNKWWEKDLVFTNQVTGVASIYVHMGYGNVASTGEFANIKLEKLDD